MKLPSDFLNEVETELREERCRLTRNRDRLAALEHLHEVAVAVAAELDRPITVFDVIRSARERHERVRRLELIRGLRTLEPSSSSTAVHTRHNHGPEEVT